MPHFIIKMLAGRSDADKARLANEVTRAVMKVTGNEEQSVSVAVEDIELQDWTEKVYNVDILPHMDALFKKPGYQPF